MKQNKKDESFKSSIILIAILTLITCGFVLVHDSKIKDLKSESIELQIQMRKQILETTEDADFRQELNNEIDSLHILYGKLR